MIERIKYRFRYPCIMKKLCSFAAALLCLVPLGCAEVDSSPDVLDAPETIDWSWDWTGDDGTVKRAHYFLKAWNRAAKRVGPFSFHSWRVYANDEMAGAEVDIIDRERIMGHRSTRTQAAYTATELSRYLAAVNRIR